MRLSLSVRIYIGLIIALAILMAISIFLPSYQDIMPSEELPASRPVLALINAGIALVIYGGLGFLGLKLASKLGFADLWDERVSNQQRFLVPMLIGVGLGVFLIIADLVFSQFHTFGQMPHPEFPTSLVASLIAGISEELIFRLFFLSFWVWVVSHVLLKKRWQDQVFWIFTVLSALAFAFGHIPSMMALYNLKTISEIPSALLSEVVLLNGVISVFAAYYFRKYGFLAPVGIHFWTDVIWHVIWGVC